MKRYVGVDLGATNVRAAVGAETGGIVASARTNTPKTTGDAVTETVLDVVREACRRASVEPDSIEAAAIGAMGRSDNEAGTVSAPSNLDKRVGSISLVDPLEALLDTDAVVIRSDTQAGAVGEFLHADSGIGNLVYLTISSGIGAGVITDGELLLGRNNNAGEVGHQTIDCDGFMTCGCERSGHWEAYCAGENIPRFTRELYEAEPVETSLPIESETLDAATVFDHAETDTFADRVIERIGELNVAGVANVVHAYAPDVVVFGGAVATENPDRVVEPVRERLPSALLVDTPNIAVTELGDSAGLVGALEIARDVAGNAR